MILVHAAATSAVLLAGLKTIIESSGNLSLASAGQAAELEQQLDHLTGDVLLLAIGELTDDWVSLLAGHSIPVVILADVAEGGLLSAALRGNIRAVLSPDSSPEEITAAIHSAAAGLLTVEPAMLDLLAHNTRLVLTEPEEALTPRELEVLAMLAEGLSNKLLAHRLSISEHTVKFHVTSIMAKLQAGSRTDAVMQGIRRGLILI